MITPVMVLASLSGAVLVGGLILAVRAFRTPPDARTGPPAWLVSLAGRAWRGPGRTAADQRRYRVAATASLTAGVTTWLLSGLPVLGLVVAAAVPGVPWLLAAGRLEKRSIARVEAIGEWTRRLRDVAGTGAGLQAAIVSAATTAPPAIEDQARMLAARLQAGWHARVALLTFADELDDPVCDQVMAALLLHLRDRGDQLGAVLTSISDATSKEVRMRKEADAERASARLSIRFMVSFTIVAVVVAAFSGDYMEPYATGQGQVIMAGLASIFIGLLLWVRSMSRPERAPRLLGRPQPGGGS
jgi:Flp pilus assembly protein TadB